jgi:hypothetical protein
MKSGLAFRILFSLAIGAALAFAFFDSHLPLTNQELSTRVLLQEIPSDCGPYLEPTPVGSATIHPNQDATTLVLEGRDNAGNPWHLETFIHGFGCSLWIADLDLNGAEDIILSYPTTGNGLAPPTGLTMLMFDAEGRPVPWDVVGYFDEDSTGIRDFLDINQDGHAELIQMRYDDGYWITSAYEAADAFWHRVDAKIGSTELPIYTRFTYRPNHQPTTPAKGRSPFNPDFSNAPGNALRTTIQEFKYTREKLAPTYYPPDRLDPYYCCKEMELVLGNGEACGPLHSWPTVVLDKAETREFGLLKGTTVRP